MKLVTAILVGDVKGVYEAIAVGTNFHLSPCKRDGMPAGTPYDACEGCDYRNHAEAKMIADAVHRYGKARMKEIGGTCVVHIHGHTHACVPCQEKLSEYGIEKYKFINPKP